MTPEESREFGRKALAAWRAMSEDERAAFILEMPYGVILELSRVVRSKGTPK